MYFSVLIYQTNINIMPKRAVHMNTPEPLVCIDMTGASESPHRTTPKKRKSAQVPKHTPTDLSGSRKTSPGGKLNDINANTRPTEYKTAQCCFMLNFVLLLSLFSLLSIIAGLYFGSPLNTTRTDAIYDTNALSDPNHERPIVTIGPCFANDTTSACYNATLELSFTPKIKELNIRPLNAVGFWGYHNSYHSGSWLCYFMKSSLPGEWCEKHPPIATQPPAFITQIEIDLNAKLTGDRTSFYVYHIPVLDPNSHELSLTKTLASIYEYMVTVPANSPLFVTFDLKGSSSPYKLCSESNMRQLHARILEYFPESWIIKPAQVIADEELGREELIEHGWPMYGSLRGGIMFVLWAYDDGNIPCVKDYERIFDYEDRVLWTHNGQDQVVLQSVFYGLDNALSAENMALLMMDRRLIRFDTNPEKGDPTPAEGMLSGANVIATHGVINDVCVDIIQPVFNLSIIDCVGFITGDNML